MTKSDLRTGYIVTTRDRGEQIVIRSAQYSSFGSKDFLVSGSEDLWNILDDYADDLKMVGNDHWDIMKVEEVSHPYDFMNFDRHRKERKLIWERKEVRDVTMEEVNAKFGEEVRIVEKK